MSDQLVSLVALRFGTQPLHADARDFCDLGTFPPNPGSYASFHVTAWMAVGFARSLLELTRSLPNPKRSGNSHSEHWQRKAADRAVFSRNEVAYRLTALHAAMLCMTGLKHCGNSSKLRRPGTEVRRKDSDAQLSALASDLRRKRNNAGMP
ncbi:hypothetical protein B0H14DRAFT_865759 [Mycena olivaceomarginata]|nr:hypothetical protein B0H14DRAFT_865759 [Mycena olivaceomarginata]